MNKRLPPGFKIEATETVIRNAEQRKSAAISQQIQAKKNVVKKKKVN